MQQSKRFILVSLFAGITISALGNNLVSLINQYPDPESGDWAPLAYSAALLVFVIKYFVDDLTEQDPKQNGKTTTRGKLILLVFAWVFFLLAALLLEKITISGSFWIIGLSFVTIFMWKSPSKCSYPKKKYIIQNIILMLILFVLLFTLLARPWLTIICNISWQQACSLILLLTTIFFLFCSAAGNNTKNEN